VRRPWFAARPVSVLAFPVLLAGAVTAAAPVTVAAARTRPAGPRASFTGTGYLSGVAAVSARDAWAVGDTGNYPHYRTLIVRWDGRAWKRVPSPSRGSASGLAGVAATSARSAWAVGYTDTSAGSMTLIEHWNRHGQ
jgi:hypothetical protein